MELGLKEPRGLVRENYSVDSLATGIVLRETTPVPGQEVSGACSSPETGVYYTEQCLFDDQKDVWLVVIYSALPQYPKVLADCTVYYYYYYYYYYY